MTKSKTTRRALLSSCIALMLCFSMLLGTTYAWFTDSVTSANNIIVAGNLDVELYYQVEGQTDWTQVTENTNIFMENALWEPGHTEVVKLKVVNEGTLALKYQLSVNVASETGSVNVADEAFKLSDYIKFGIVDGDKDYTREQAVAAVDATATALKEAYNSGTVELAKAEEKIVTMVVYMPTTVGNEANYRGNAVPTINLGLNLLATQMEAEMDSFGNDYDADADLLTTTVTNEAELVAALADAETGDVIGISGNVTWTTGAGIGSTPFVTNAGYITLKGVDENATFTAIGSGVGAVGIDNGTVVFKNLKIADESVSYAENSWEYGYLEFRGNTIFENCNVVNAIMMEGDSAKFTNCSFNSGKDNEYAVWVSDGDASFENCDFTGARGLKVHEAYGSEVDSVKVNNSTFANLTKKPGVAIGDVNADTSISLTKNMFVGTQPGDQGNYKYESDTDTTKFNFVDDNNTVAAEATVSTAGDLIAALNDPNATSISLELANDIEFEEITTIEPGKDVHLNLNGKTITVDKNTPSNTLLYVKEGAKLTIDGNGIIDLGSVSTMAIFAPKGELVIENGTFIRDKVTTVTNKTTGLFMGAKAVGSNVTINGGYFDPGYYDANAADIDEILAGTKEFTETDDDIAKRGNSKDANPVRVAVKDNVSVVLNHSGYGSFKVYGGTFVGANPAWGDEGCMLPTTPNYLRPWSYYQGALLDGQTFHEDGIVLPAGYTITKGTTDDGIPTYTVAYSEQ